MDGFTLISSCFFALTLAVTFALIIQINFGLPQVTPHGAVATDDQQCSEIGVNIMKDGGNSIDAVIASLLCLSVTHPHIVGPGGGGVLILHDHKKNFSKAYDFMTAIPQGQLHSYYDNKDVLSIGVPGFIKGLEKIHELHGKLAWKKLFQPVIELARHGFPISKQLVEELGKSIALKLSSDFKNTFLPKGVIPVSGSVITRSNFARFLEDVASGGSDEFYLLKYGVEVMEALKAAGANVSVHDFQNYTIKERNLLTRTFLNKTLLTVGLPFGGLQVVEGIGFLDSIATDFSSSESSLYESLAHGLLIGAASVYEAFTSGFSGVNNSNFENSERAALDNDELYAKVGSIEKENPAAQVSAIDTHDLYVTAVVGLGSSFGSGISTKHEIILNNHLAFHPPHFHEENENQPIFERAISSYTPLIMLDANKVCGRRVVLSSGSPSAMFQVVGQLLFKNLDMAPSIIEPRIILGKEPRSILLNDFDDEGHKLSTKVREHFLKQNFTFGPLLEPFAVNGVSKMGDTVVSHSDTRLGGFAARINAYQES